MKPLEHIEFKTINQPVKVVSYFKVIRPEDCEKVVGETNQCHHNATINSGLISVWNTPIEYVEGYIHNGIVGHAFNRAKNDKGEYVYFDATLEQGRGVSADYYYAVRAFTRPQIAKVFLHYNHTFLTFDSTYIDGLELTKEDKAKYDVSEDIVSIDNAFFLFDENAPFLYDDNGNFVIPNSEYNRTINNERMQRISTQLAELNN